MAAVARATTTSGWTSSRARRRRVAAAIEAANRSAGIDPLAPTANPRFRRARRRITGSNVPHGPASHTRTWNELLPRSPNGGPYRHGATVAASTLVVRLVPALDRSCRSRRPKSSPDASPSVRRHDGDSANRFPIVETWTRISTSSHSASVKGERASWPRPKRGRGRF